MPEYDDAVSVSHCHTECFSRTAQSGAMVMSAVVFVLHPRSCRATDGLLLPVCVGRSVVLIDLSHA